MADEKAKKAAFKEGGKKGVDLSGVSDMGGVSYFNIAVETPNGDLDLLQAVLDGSNQPVDEAAEERKGGAGGLGKVFLSAGDKQLAIIAHVPKELAAAKGLGLKEWVEAVLSVVDGKVVEETDEVIKAVALGDPAADKFPLKMRDAALAAGIALLREKGLIPADDSSDDIDYAEAAGVEW